MSYPPINLAQYEIVVHIGSGSFGCTMLVKKDNVYSVLKIMVTKTLQGRLDVKREVGIQDEMYGAGMNLFLEIYSHKEYSWRLYPMPDKFTRAIREECPKLSNQWEEIKKDHPGAALHLVLMQPGNIPGLLSEEDVTLKGVQLDYDSMKTFTFLFIYGLYEVSSQYGFIHGDLKTSNAIYSVTTEEQEIQYGESTFVIPEGVLAPFMIDFGFSRLTKDPFSYDYGLENASNGTILYMSPEVLTNMHFKENMDKLTKIDIWSLGIILLNIAVGSVVDNPHFMPNLARSVKITRALKSSVRTFLDLYFLWRALHDVRGRRKSDFKQYLPTLSENQILMLSQNDIDITNSNKDGMVNMRDIENAHPTYRSREMHDILDQHLEDYGASFRDLLKILLAWNPVGRNYDDMLNHPYFLELKENDDDDDDDEEQVEKKREFDIDTPSRPKRIRVNSCIGCPKKALLRCKCHQKRYCGKECAYKDHR